MVLHMFLALRWGRLALSGCRGESAALCLFLLAQDLPRYLQRGCGAVFWSQHLSLGILDGFCTVSSAFAFSSFIAVLIQVSESWRRSVGICIPTTKMCSF